MEILRQLTELQHERGYLDDATLREVAVQFGVPLYRVEGLVSFYPAFRRTPPPRVTLRVCRDVSCALADACGATAALRDRIADQPDVEIEEVSCLGRCDSAPAVSLNDVPLAPVNLHDTEEILKSVAVPPALEFVSTPRSWTCDPYASASDRYTTVNSVVDQGGAHTEEGIESLLASGLRGMGGAGFPTGRKWQLVRGESAQPKYVICNADESEPGTFKDRMILEQLPHLVIEGMLLAGLTIGAEQGIVYLRHEYGREQLALEAELERARARGVLGDNAAGSGHAFDIEIFVSPGGYILGEETALLEALEDKRGEPRNKPPYPGTYGLWGKPTLINNVETFALATAIVQQGSEWWEVQGLGAHSGLKFVSISGDVARPGAFEIPIGTTVADLIELAGGMKDGQPLRAFLPGGASSNFLTAAHVNTPLDFDAMQKAGSMLGTGAVIVIAEGRDLFALATNIVRFFRNESCGKCVPCRLGTEKVTGMLERVHAGQESPDALAVLDELGHTLEQTSICGLGQVALNPILSMMKHFPDDVPQ